MGRNGISLNKFRRWEYTSRINRVIDYIEANIENPMSLEELSRVALFSPYHFHRIFSAMIGESLFGFIQRLRLEKAASRLIIYPEKAITEIALDLGFSSSAVFARAFKETFGMSASDWRNGGYGRRKAGQAESKEGKTNHNGGKADLSDVSYFDVTEIRSEDARALINQINRRRIMLDKKELEVAVKHMDPFHVAYIRHIGPYKGDAELFRGLFGRLMQWAGPRGLLEKEGAKVLTIYHDDPEVTAPEKLRTSVCVSVPKDQKVEGDIGKMEIAGGKYAFARFTLGPEEYEEAWKSVFGVWLPGSGYQPADGPCFELYHNNCDEHPEKKSIVDICIPVEPV